MGKAKKKIEPELKAKHKAGTPHSKPRSSPELPEGIPEGKLVEVWAEEVSDLLGQDFTSEEEVVSAVIERVVARLGDENTAADMRQFLEDLIETDPDMKGELMDMLLVK